MSCSNCLLLAIVVLLYVQHWVCGHGHLTGVVSRSLQESRFFFEFLAMFYSSINTFSRKKKNTRSRTWLCFFVGSTAVTSGGRSIEQSRGGCCLDAG